MQSLLSGADCSVSANPLHQALKSFSHDTSLQRDLAASGSNAAYGSSSQAGPSQQFKMQQQSGNANHLEADRFFRDAVATPHHGHFNQQRMPSPYDMAEMRQAMPSYKQGDARQMDHAPGGAGASAWAQDFAQMRDAERLSHSSSPALNHQQMPQVSSQYRPSPMMASSNMMTMNGGGMMYNQPSYGGMYGADMSIDGHYASRSFYNTTDKGKGKETMDSRFIELSDDQWESEFSKFSQLDAEEADPRLDHTERQGETTTEDEVNEDDDELLAEIDKKWRSMKNTFDHQNAADKEMAAWEAQYASQFSDPDFELPQTNVTLEDIVQHANEQEWNNLTSSEENAYKEHADPFAEGKRLLAEGAPFNLVEQAFEEAVRRDPTRSEAWVALGETLAADEKETLAIKALEKAISGNGRGVESAWLSIAISFINEGQDPKAMVALQEWLRRCYPQLVPAESLLNMEPVLEKDGTPVANPWQSHQKMIDVFLAAARSGSSARLSATRSPEVEDGSIFIDPDVQIGLGVLFYANHDYAYAKDCFEAALSVRPKDYILWNRLGATLANGGQPEEAISAYRQALALRPNFTRSLYNLAVSCLNINCAHEAAEHLLAALDLQGGSGKGDESGPLWSTLRRAFFHMERPDLANRANMGTDVQSFKKDGFNF